MVHLTIFFIHFSILVTSLLDCALKAEGIIGGTPANRRAFPYQVAILGIKNFTSSIVPICSGGIVSDYFILSAAHCFINDVGELKAFRFLAKADVIDLASTTGINLQISEIYTYKNDYILYIHDIALAKLDISLNLEKNTFLRKVLLPQNKKSLKNQVGLIAGYGADRIETIKNIVTGSERRCQRRTNFTLKFLHVKILKNSQCSKNYPEVLTQKQFCGITFATKPGQRHGLCTGDYGALLVIGQTVMGIASRNRPDCDDTVYGCIYTKVSAFTHFIEAIIRGSPLRQTFRYINRIYLPR